MIRPSPDGSDQIRPIHEETTGGQVTIEHSYENGKGVGNVKGPHESSIEKLRLIRCYGYLRENIVAEQVCDYLYNNGIIEESDCQTIQNQPSMSDKVDVLLQTLLQKRDFGAKEYEAFLTAVDLSGFPWVLTKLNVSDEELPDNDCAQDTTSVKQCLESHLEELADDIDTIPVAITCLQQTAIKIEDYVEIFQQRSGRVASAKCLLYSIIKDLPYSFTGFKLALEQHKCQTALELLQRQTKPTKNKMKAYAVSVKNESVTITKLKSTDDCAAKFVISFHDDKIEVKMLQNLKSNKTKTTELFTKCIHAEYKSSETGSVVINLTAYDDKLLNELLRDDDTEYASVCGLLEQLIREHVVTEDIPAGNHRLILKIEIASTRGNTKKYAEKICISPGEIICRRKEMLCNVLNPTTCWNKLIAHDRTKFGQWQTESKNLTRKERMDSLIKIIMLDSKLHNSFMEIVRQLDSDLHKRLVWFGTHDELVRGILHNYEYLVEELVPDEIIPLMEKQGMAKELCTYPTNIKDRRSRAVLLLKNVLSGGVSVSGCFYDALCSACLFEAVDRIRRSAEVDHACNETGNVILHESMTDHDTMTLRFEGEFCIHVQDENDKHADSTTKNSDVFISTNDNNLWETTTYSTDMHVNERKAFRIKPLDNSKEATVEAIVSYDNTMGSKTLLENTYIIHKRTFRDTKSIDIELTPNNTCIISSSFGAVGDIENVTLITFVMRCANVSIVESQADINSDADIEHGSVDTKKKSNTYSFLLKLRKNVRSFIY